MSKTKKVVSDLLLTVPVRLRTSSLDTNVELREALIFFLDLKAKEDPRAAIAFAWFYNHKLKPRFNGPNVNTVRGYVRDVLRRCVVTGKSL